MSTASNQANSIPAAAVYARACGKIDFTCPNCSHQHATHLINWRRGLLQCAECKTRYQLGLAFALIKAADAYLMGKWNSHIVNHFGVVYSAPYLGCKLYGSIEWVCPACTKAQQNFLSADGRLGCVDCTQQFHISALLYRIPKWAKPKAPYDSVLKIPYVKTTHHPIPLETPSAGAGTPSHSVGDIS